MKNNLLAAVVLGIALVLASILNRGIYEFHAIEGDPFLYLRINRLDSAYALCFAEKKRRYRCVPFQKDNKLEYVGPPSAAPSPSSVVPPGDLPSEK